MIKLMNQRGLSSILVLLGILFVTLVSIGTIYFGNFSNKPNLDSNIVSIKQMIKPSLKEDFLQRVYKNQKYGFKFLYTEDALVDGKLSDKYEVEDNTNKIVLKEYIKSKQGDYGIYSMVYTIYDAKVEDKNNLAQWWKDNVKKEVAVDGIISTNQSFDSNLKENQLNFQNCILQKDPTWKAPPSLQVTQKRLEDLNTIVEYSVFYLYYDFGKPFIIRFEQNNPSLCKGHQAVETLTSIDSLSY